MKNPFPVAALLILAAIAPLSAQGAGGHDQQEGVVIRIEAGGEGRVAATNAPDTGLLAQFGYAGDFGASLEYGRITVFRFGLSLFRIAPSGISPDGQLYRGWEGTRFSAEAGYSWEVLHTRLAVLAGGALSAAGYSGTPLVFAYPSILLGAKLDLGKREGFGFWLALPLELVIRGSLLTPSASLAAGIRWTVPSGRKG